MPRAGVHRPEPTFTPRTRAFLTAVILAALAVPSCKKEPAAVARPKTAPVSVAEWQRELANAVKQRIEQFQFGFYLHLDRYRIVGVCLNLTGAPSRIGLAGAPVTITTMRLTEPEAERLVDKLSKDQRIRRTFGCSSRILPASAYFRVGGSAGPDYEVDEILEPGAKAEARIEELAAVLDPDARDAVHNLIAKARRLVPAGVPSDPTARANADTLPHP